MSAVHWIEGVWAQHQGLLAKMAGAIITASGWVFALWRWWKSEQPLLSIEMDGQSSVVVVNHGSKSVDLLQSGFSVTDPLAREELAMKRQFVAGISGSVQPKERKKILEVDAPLVNAVMDVSGRFARTLAEYNGPDSVYYSVQFDLHLRCCVVGSNKVRVVHFERSLSGRPDVGWGIGFGPYHHDRLAPLHQRVSRKLTSAVAALAHPRAFVRRRKSRRQLGEHLHVLNVLEAIRDKTITEEDGIRRLERIAAKAGVAPTELVEQHVKQAQERHQSNLAFAQGDRSGTSPPASTAP